MGITVKMFGPIPVDRSISKLEINTSADNRDDWKIEVHFQDAPYDADGKRLDEPRSGTDYVAETYGAVKDVPLPGAPLQVSKISDLLPIIRALGYTLRQRMIERNEQEAKEIAERAAAAAKGTEP